MFLSLARAIITPMRQSVPELTLSIFVVHFMTAGAVTKQDACCLNASQSQL